ncbi:MAG: 2-keto-3-deoxygluconate kinase, partial [Spirochaetae bacterium HGW-Spirochaetae-7]
MSLALKKDCAWSLVVPTSMGVRLTPGNGQAVHVSNSFMMQATSAETNVASIVSCLGMPVKVLTTFVKDSPIAAFIKSDLRARNMQYEGVEVPQGGPWGYRHQFNIADSGFGNRGPRVQNDRAGEVGRTLDVRNFDLERIFGKEGVRIVHLSGLIGALSPETGAFCLEIAKAARKHGTRVSFDLNYRASFWKGREKELHDLFAEIAGLSDILVGNEEDFQLCLGIEGPKAGGKGISAQIEGFIDMIGRTRKVFPGTSVFATTLREVEDANRHLWGAIVVDGEARHVVQPREIRVLDRIGGGDGFVGGLLYGILKGWE